MSPVAVVVAPVSISLVALTGVPMSPVMATGVPISPAKAEILSAQVSANAAKRFLRLFIENFPFRDS